MGHRADRDVLRQLCWHSREEYETFVQAYGFNIMTRAGTLREIRESLMVTSVIQKASENAATATEARKRTTALQTRASRKDWQPS
jgi:predicted metal-dependent hydrolase